MCIINTSIQNIYNPHLSQNTSLTYGTEIFEDFWHFFFLHCSMTSLNVVTYMYTINSSYVSFVPAKDATARNHADLFINLWITLNDWNRLFSLNIVFILSQEDTTWRSKARWKIKKQPKVRALQMEKPMKEQTQKPKRHTRKLPYQHSKNAGYRRRSSGGGDLHSTLKWPKTSIST